MRWAASDSTLSVVAGGGNMHSYGNAFIAESCSATRCTNATAANTYVSCPFDGQGSATDDGLPATAACLKSPVAVYVERSTGLVVVADAYYRLRAYNGSVSAPPIVTVSPTSALPSAVTDLSQLYDLTGAASPKLAAVVAVGTFIASARVERSASLSSVAALPIFLRTDNDCSEATLASSSGLAAASVCMTPVSIAFPRPMTVEVRSLVVSDVGNGALWTVNLLDQTAQLVAGNVYSAQCVPAGPTGGLTPAQIGDGGPATSACITAPMSIVLGTQRDIFFTDSSAFYGGTTAGGLDAQLFADFSGSRVRRVYASDSTISTLVGARGGLQCGNTASSGDGGPASSACLLGPAQLALESDDAGLWVTDVYSGSIWRVSLQRNPPMIYRVAGIAGTAIMCTQSPTPPVGVFTNALATPLCQPSAISVAPTNTIYFIDGMSETLRMLTTSNPSRESGYQTAVVASVSGAVSFSRLSFGPIPGYPLTLYISLPFKSSVSKLTLTNVTVAAGPAVIAVGQQGVYDDSTTNGDGGPATLAGLRFPLGVAVDSGNNVYLADLAAGRVRAVVSGSHVACPQGYSCACVTPVACLDDASKICSGDTVVPQTVQPGYYSVPDASRGGTLSSQRACPIGR